MSDAVRISDYSDRELLAIIGDLARSNGHVGGVVTALEVACRVFGVKPGHDDIAHFTKCVTARFTWMRRFGLLDKEDEPGAWSLSQYGNRLRRATLPAPIRTGIARAGEGNALELAHAVGERMVKADDQAATVMRRELTFQADRRKQLTTQPRRARRRRW